MDLRDRKCRSQANAALGHIAAAPAGAQSVRFEAPRLLSQLGQAAGFVAPFPRVAATVSTGGAC